MDKIGQMKKLITELNKASFAYYNGNDQVAQYPPQILSE